MTGIFYEKPMNSAGPSNDYGLDSQKENRAQLANCLVVPDRKGNPIPEVVVGAVRTVTKRRRSTTSNFIPTAVSAKPAPVSSNDKLEFLKKKNS